jgi:hypothetical protein
MARVFVFFILLSSAFTFAQEAKPNPDNYKVNVHVRSSRLNVSCGGVALGSSSCSANHQLKVEIDGKTYDLTSQGMYAHFGLLRTGNYKARILKEDTKLGNEYTRTYELLFSDGRTRKYSVTGEYELEASLPISEK